MECSMKVNRKCLFMKGEDKIKSSPANKVQYICVLICMCIHIHIISHKDMRYNLYRYYCVAMPYLYY